MHKNYLTVTNVIIAINVFLYFFATYTQTEGDFVLYTSNPSILNFFSAAFMHGSISHLAFNMFFLYSFGPIIEKYIGKVLYVVYYIAMIILSGVILTIINDNTAVVGASGVLYAMMGTILILSVFKAPNIYINRNGILQLIGINLVLSFVVPGISVSGHIAGLISGVIAGFIILYYKERVSR